MVKIGYMNIRVGLICDNKDKQCTISNLSMDNVSNVEQI